MISYFKINCYTTKVIIINKVYQNIICFLGNHNLSRNINALCLLCPKYSFEVKQL